MSIAEKLKLIFSNQKAISEYEKNKAAKQMVDHVTSYGVRTNFSYAFSRCDYSGVTFCKEIVPTANINHMFYYYQGSRLPEGINLSKMAKNSSTSALFARSLLTEIPDIKLPAMNEYLNTFLDCEKLKKIALVRSSKNTKYSYAFNKCTSLTSVAFEGEIGKNINFSHCINLNKTSIRNIISHLYDYSAEGGNHTLTLGSTNLSKLTEEEEQIVIDKGWTLV